MPKPGPRTIHRYSDAFKAAAVRLSQQPGVRVGDVAQSLYIHPYMLSRWRRLAREGVIVTKGAPVDPSTAAELKATGASLIGGAKPARSSAEEPIPLDVRFGSEADVSIAPRQRQRLCSPRANAPISRAGLLPRVARLPTMGSISHPAAAHRLRPAMS